MTDITPTIQALTSDQAARVLALTMDHAAPLPDPAELRTLDTGLRAALSDDTELAEYASPADQAADPRDTGIGRVLTGQNPALEDVRYLPVGRYRGKRVNPFNWHMINFRCLRPSSYIGIRTDTSKVIESPVT